MTLLIRRFPASPSFANGETELLDVVEAYGDAPGDTGVTIAEEERALDHCLHRLDLIGPQAIAHECSGTFGQHRRPGFHGIDAHARPVQLHGETVADAVECCLRCAVGRDVDRGRNDGLAGTTPMLGAAARKIHDPSFASGDHRRSGGQRKIERSIDIHFEHDVASLHRESR